jgi:hypothetical protein
MNRRAALAASQLRSSVSHGLGIIVRRGADEINIRVEEKRSLLRNNYADMDLYPVQTP